MTRLDLATFHRQEAFIRSLSARPDLGRHVRELHWTVMDLSHPHEEEWDDIEMMDHFEKQRVMLQEQVYADALDKKEFWYFTNTAAHDARQQSLWQTFGSFVNVSSINICWLL
jgi:hypothetical protein